MLSTFKFIRKSLVQHNFLAVAQKVSRSFATACGDGDNNGLVLGVYEKSCSDAEYSLTETSEMVNKRTENRLVNLMTATGFDGKLGTSMIYNNIDTEFRSIAVVGLGKSDVSFNKIEVYDEARENARVAAAIGVRALFDEECKTIGIDDMEHAECVAEGSTLALWRYQENISDSRRRIIPNVSVYNSCAQEAFIRGQFKGQSQNLARDLCDIPGNLMTPLAFAQATVDALCPCGVNVEVHEKEWIELQNMDAFLTVANSSCEAPIFVEINYCGGKVEDSPILLVGSGLTYDRYLNKK